MPAEQVNSPELRVTEMNSDHVTVEIKVNVFETKANYGKYSNVTGFLTEAVGQEQQMVTFHPTRPHDTNLNMNC